MLLYKKLLLMTFGSTLVIEANVSRGRVDSVKDKFFMKTSKNFTLSSSLAASHLTCQERPFFTLLASRSQIFSTEHMDLGSDTVDERGLLYFRDSYFQQSPI